MGKRRRWEADPERVGQLFASTEEYMARARLKVADTAREQGWPTDELVDVIGALGLLPEQSEETSDD